MKSHYSTASVSKETLLSRFFRFASAVMEPLLPAMLASALVQGGAVLLAAFGLLSAESSTYIILRTIGGAFFYFFPILLAYSLAGRIGSSQPLAILVAAILVHPDLTALISGKNATFLRLPVRGTVYPGSVLPILLTVLLMKSIERIGKRFSPGLLKGFLKPLIVLLLTIPLALWAIGPLCSLAGDTLASGFHILYRQIDWLAVSLLALIMPILILFGVHRIPIAAGDEPLWNTALLAATVSLLGAMVALLLRSRDKSLRQTALGAGIATLAGVPEPALYGAALRRGAVLTAVCIGAGAGGFYASLAGIQSVAASRAPSMILLVGNAVDSLASGANGRDYGEVIHLAVALLIISVLSFGLTWVFHRSASTAKEKSSPSEAAVAAFAGTPSSTVSAREAPTAEETPLPSISLVSPLSGKVIPLSQVSDPVFSSGVMGQGCAILPVLGKIYAPCNGTVTSIADAGNSLSIDSSEGVQLLIHVGRDTAKLAGKYFDPCCRAGDPIKEGDLLLSFDPDGLRREGFDLTTPLLVVNADRYEDLSLTCETKVKAGDRLLTLMPGSRS